jgi:hypothetical protein
MQKNIKSTDLAKAKVVLAIALSVGTVAGCMVIVSDGLPGQEETFSELACLSEVAPGIISEKEEGAEIVTDDNAAQWSQHQDLIREFRNLHQQWRDERGAKSTVAEMAMLPAYQKIMGMGPQVVPMILTELKAEGESPDHWFWALAAITRENPVPPQSRGKIREMAKAWLEWGERTGHVQLV